MYSKRNKYDIGPKEGYLQRVVFIWETIASMGPEETTNGAGFVYVFYSVHFFKTKYHIPH